MTDPIAVHVPHENVNDESVKLLQWFVTSGQRVEEGQLLAELETSKATFEIKSPAGGFVAFALEAGREIEVGGVLCNIGESPSTSPPSAETPSNGKVRSSIPIATHAAFDAQTASPEALPAARGTRLSAEAQKLIREHGLDPGVFAGKGLIRASDVLAALGERPGRATSPAPSATASPVGAAGVPTRVEEIARSKRIEARYLSSGQQNTIQSVVTVSCPTRGLRAAASAKMSSLPSAAAGLIVLEAAKLLRKYPIFNAYFADGRAHFYEHVNIGYAIDAGRGLKVPVICEADQMRAADIAERIQDLVVQYVEDEIAVESLAGGTFTVTDLSAEGVFAFHPLINQGQSAILGIGGEFIPTQGGEGMFNLILAFDHQLSEGRTAAKFLGDLRDRISGYEQALLGEKREEAPEPYCSECLTPVSQLNEYSRHLVQVVGAGGKTILICRGCLIGQF